MANERDVVIVGAGHNGLVAAASLAKAGCRPLVLEARAVVGGRSVTEEIHPGFRCSSVLHAAGPLLPAIAQGLELDKHGLAWLTPGLRVFAPMPDGRSLRIYDDAARTAAELRSLSERDAEAYPAFAAAFARIGATLAPLLATRPPAAEAPGARDLLILANVARRLRGLGRKDAYRVLRWASTPVADLTSEWFEGETLRAIVAARGIHASLAGPLSAGTSAGLLLQAAADGHTTLPAAFPRGGMGALTAALASATRSLGGEIRTEAPVQQILVRGGVARGVVLASGEEIAARAVVSNADPRTTLLSLVDGSELGPAFTSKVRNYRCTGAVAKVNLALARLPRFAALQETGDAAALSGRIHIGPHLEYLERAFDAAKYGEISPHPYLDVTIPTLLDASLAPEGAHVMSIHAQFAPYALRRGDWAGRRSELLKIVVQTLAAYAPDLPDVIVGHQVLAPPDLEERYGLSGGHLLHGEPSLDQLFSFRPLIGWAQYRTPIARLYLCGSGTHPGATVTGASGANASREVLGELRS
jgi:phytoene dehydrogenase-like protein